MHFMRESSRNLRIELENNANFSFLFIPSCPEEVTVGLTQVTNKYFRII